MNAEFGTLCRGGLPPAPEPMDVAAAVGGKRTWKCTHCGAAVGGSPPWGRGAGRLV